MQNRLLFCSFLDFAFGPKVLLKNWMHCMEHGARSHLKSLITSKCEYTHIFLL